MLVKTVDTNQSCITLTVHILPKVTCDLPLQRASIVKQLPQIKRLKLADPRFDQPGRIDLMIGGDCLGKLILSKPIAVLVQTLSHSKPSLAGHSWALTPLSHLHLLLQLPTFTTPSVFPAPTIYSGSFGRQKISLQNHTILPRKSQFLIILSLITLSFQKVDFKLCCQGNQMLLLWENPASKPSSDSNQSRFQSNEASITCRGT